MTNSSIIKRLIHIWERIHSIEYEYWMIYHLFFDMNQLEVPGNIASRPTLKSCSYGSKISKRRKSELIKHDDPLTVTYYKHSNSLFNSRLY